MPNMNDFIDQIMGASASGSSTSSSEPSVFFGAKTAGAAAGRVISGPSRSALYDKAAKRPSPMGPKTQVTASRNAEDDLKSLSQAKLTFYQWSDAERNKWGDHLASLGLIEADESRDYAVLKTLWDDVVGESANFMSAGRKLTPWEVASLIGGADGGKAGKSKGFTGSKKQVSTDVDLTDPKTAKALVNDVLSRSLGRAANAEELSAFASTLQAAERANPVTTTTTGEHVDGDQVSSSSTTSGGLAAAGKQQLLLDQAMQKPDYGAYQAATTYFDALRSAVQSPV